MSDNDDASAQLSEFTLFDQFVHRLMIRHTIKLNSVSNLTHTCRHCSLLSLSLSLIY